MESISAKNLFAGLWASAPAGLAVTAVVTDSRAVLPGSVFVAIKGQRVDGHDFAAAAFQQGAALVVASHPVDGLPPDRTVLVKDPLDAMIAMGANYRSRYSPLVLAVTGSVGKTTTKEYCGTVFSAFGKTLKTQGNQNNEIGMPNTLFRLDNSVNYAVLEMGMQGPGEIHKLSVAAKPDAAIITRIGPAHIQQLGSLENILRAKLEVCDGLPSGAPLVLGGDDELLRSATLPSGVRPVYAGSRSGDVRAEDIRRAGAGQYFTIVDEQFGRHKAYIPALGRHQIDDAMLAYAAATRLGLGASAAATALASYRPADMRQQILDVAGTTVIEDCYNANPDSMRAALATLAELDAPGRTIAVLGDMLELGEVAKSAHEELGREVANAGVAELICVGEWCRYTVQAAEKQGVGSVLCQSNADAAARLQALAKPGDAVLIKASRGMHFEEIFDIFAGKSEVPTG